jgi:hypothetical protein
MKLKKVLNKARADYQGNADFRIPPRTYEQHPVRKVPGRSNYRWDPWIERWVVGRLSYESAPTNT